jgi:hypothetical protein
MRGAKNKAGRHLSVVPEAGPAPEGIRRLQAYAGELLFNPDHTPRDIAGSMTTPFANSGDYYFKTIFRRDGPGYALSFYETLDPDFSSYEVVAQPYCQEKWRIFRPEVATFAGGLVCVTAGSPLPGHERGHEHEPTLMLDYLEHYFGPLPEAIQEQFGLTQTLSR